MKKDATLSARIPRKIKRWLEDQPKGLSDTLNEYLLLLYEMNSHRGIEEDEKILLQELAEEKEELEQIQKSISTKQLQLISLREQRATAEREEIQRAQTLNEEVRNSGLMQEIRL